jgi:hypothetical protein
MINTNESASFLKDVLGVATSVKRSLIHVDFIGKDATSFSYNPFISKDGGAIINML